MNDGHAEQHGSRAGIATPFKAAAQTSQFIAALPSNPAMLPHLSIAHARQQAAQPLSRLPEVVNWPRRRLLLLMLLLRWLRLWLLLLHGALRSCQLLSGLVQQRGGGLR